MSKEVIGTYEEKRLSLRWLIKFLFFFILAFVMKAGADGINDVRSNMFDSAEYMAIWYVPYVVLVYIIVVLSILEYCDYLAGSSLNTAGLSDKTILSSVPASAIRVACRSYGDKEVLNHHLAISCVEAPLRLHGYNKLQKTSCDLGMHFGKFRVNSVKIGNLRVSDAFRKTTRPLTEYTHRFPEGIRNFFNSDLYRLLTEIAEVRYTPVT